jgi:acetyltransferase
VPEPIDLAVIATPARTVPNIVGDCSSVGVGGAIIISAGFKEIGERGAALEQDILRQARGSKMRIVGPNCLGIMNPYYGLNATFATSMARPGHVGLISQSGALCTAILDWSQREMVGFSAFVSVGSMLDVGWGDLIQYLGDDPNTRSIVIYMESVGDAHAFVSAAREVALSKPIIVLKPGRTEAAAKAAASHTGALTGADDVLDAALRRCGVVRVDSIAELFYLSEALDKQPRPKGPNLTIVTNAGGPAVLATDVLLANGGRLTELSQNTVDQLNGILPRHWSHHNPIDIIGDAGPDRYVKGVEIAAKDSATDGLLVILAPTGLTDPTLVAKQLTPFSKLSGKPVIASWMGGRDVAQGDAILSEAGIPTYSYPDAAARVFQLMWSYSANLKALYETPESFESEDPNAAIQAAARTEATRFIDAARAKGRTLLTEPESKIVLAAYGIPTVRTEIATSSDGAVEIANQIGYPVVLKLHSETITHKTDVGGVHLDLRGEAAVRDAYLTIEESVTRAAGREHFLGVTVQPMVRPEGQQAGYELILGSSVDPQFGPILLFGSGGQLVEIYKDRAIGLPPLNTTLAQRLVESTKIHAALRGVRGRQAVDLTELGRLLVRFSYLVMEQRWIKEIDINPLLASSDGLLALDARVVLYSQDVLEPPRAAIRAYPVQYVDPWRFADGTEVLIRPIRPEDEQFMAAFHARLSERSIYQRYFHMLSLDQRVAHERLVRVCFGDYDREIALVAEHRHSGKADPDLVAVARLSKAHLLNEAELAAVIVDEFQGRGLGTEMFRRLIEIARTEKLERVTVEILAGNHQMIEVCRELGFSFEHAGGDVIHGVLLL